MKQPNDGPTVEPNAEQSTEQSTETKGMSPNAYLLAATLLIELIAKLVGTARRQAEWTADEEAALQEKWDTAFSADHWKVKDATDLPADEPAPEP